MKNILRVFTKILLLSTLLPITFISIIIIFISLITRIFSHRLSVKVATVNSLIIWTVFDLIFKISFNFKVPEIPKDNFIVISNHIGSADFMLINGLNKHHFKDSKYTIKQSLWKIPIFYQGCILLDFLILRRSFDKDKAVIKEFMEKLKGSAIPAWFVLFVEGHRFTEARKVDSDKFCRERGIEPFKNTLCPRVKGFELIFENLKDSYIKKVLDVTFYCNNNLTFFNILFSGCVYDLKCDVRTVDLNDIKNPSVFLFDAFRRKDELIDKWKNK